MRNAGLPAGVEKKKYEKKYFHPEKKVWKKVSNEKKVLKKYRTKKKYLKKSIQYKVFWNFISIQIEYTYFYLGELSKINNTLKHTNIVGLAVAVG